MIIDELSPLPIHKGRPGLGWALASAAAFGSSGSFATSLLGAGWSPLAAVAVRIAVATLALTVPAVLALRSEGLPSPADLRAIASYGLVAVASGQLCYFEAIQHLSVAVALLLEYSGTALVVGWMWARHGHRPNRATGAGLAMAVIGLALVLGVLSGHHLSAAGVAWGLGAAVCMAAYFLVAASGGSSTSPVVFAWGSMGVGTVAVCLVAAAGILPWHAPRAQVMLGHGQVSWLISALGLGLLAGGFAYVTGIAAARRLGAQVASFVGLAEVIASSAYAWLLIGQHLDPAQLAGAALVVAGVVLVKAGEGTAPGVAAAEPATAAEAPALAAA